MKSIHILLVEDNEGDILLTTEALQEGRILNTISIVRDGEEAIDFLDKKGKHTLAEHPDLVLLDVNLPRKNGHEVLQYIKKSDQIKHIPVIMLTTSCSEKDISLSNKNKADCYITKPVELESFLKVIKQIENFWISIIAKPSLNKF
jgi:CheY-like chemotaxis protein